jgi:hypothetical protein
MSFIPSGSLRSITGERPAVRARRGLNGMRRAPHKHVPEMENYSGVKDAPASGGSRLHRAADPQRVERKDSWGSLWRLILAFGDQESGSTSRLGVADHILWCAESASSSTLELRFHSASYSQFAFGNFTTPKPSTWPPGPRLNVGSSMAYHRSS